MLHRYRMPFPKPTRRGRFVKPCSSVSYAPVATVRGSSIRRTTTQALAFIIRGYTLVIPNARANGHVPMPTARARLSDFGGVAEQVPRRQPGANAIFTSPTIKHSFLYELSTIEALYIQGRIRSPPERADAWGPA
ncbi:hypothetical protein BWQ96_01663 [Gracilariopsis chorda]|uniref:Uncharacterized protein n=1 Tax=Gracilariopsis chorda TaxID=448386 RepID=A0A2V3J272_9FLOR|nr:hypothetical protein BWQ96_01663 [Gracilariopsis chorda]|eukprot:PXF48494.1 hypothetical protein BWQ96_01663 [Gracilariopsis chorda]